MTKAPPKVRTCLFDMDGT